jgi:hypothetical protein
MRYEIGGKIWGESETVLRIIGWRKHRVGESTGLEKAPGWRKHRVGASIALEKPLKESR